MNRVPRYRFDWLVPGLLRDKCIALIKTLPKQLRKQLVPVPDYADQVLSRIKADDVPLLEVLSREFKQLSNVTIALEAWKPDQLDTFYRMNFCIIDADDKTLGQGRNLEQLVQQFKGQATETVQQQADSRFQTDNITHWDFGELPKKHEFLQAGVTVTSYPALVDCKDSVAIELKDYPEEAELVSRRGLVRLYMLQMPQQLKTLRKKMLQGNEINLLLAGLSHIGETQQREQWLEDLLYVVFYRLFIEGQPSVRSDDDFKQRLNSNKSQIVTEAQAINTLLMEIASAYNTIRKQLKKANELAWAMAVADIKQQLALLFAKGFITDTPIEYLQQYPRYLAAISQRLEKLRGHFQRDKQLSLGINTMTSNLMQEWSNNMDAQQRSDLLLEYRWLLEEYRVSLFAQQLKTRKPVSEKRLKELWKQVKQSLLDLSS